MPQPRLVNTKRSEGSMGKKRIGKETFGQYIRRRRMEKQFTLREFARQVGVSPTYMSHVEQDMSDPPTAERVRKMAELLDENPDELIAMAGRLPEDLSEIIQNRATEMPELLREASGLTPDQLQKVRDQIRKLKEQGEK
jgi:transcriptional regulator with XRE-family HTH domain